MYGFARLANLCWFLCCGRLEGIWFQIVLIVDLMGCWNAGIACVRNSVEGAKRWITILVGYLWVVLFTIQSKCLYWLQTLIRAI